MNDDTVKTLIDEIASTKINRTLSHTWKLAVFISNQNGRTEEDTEEIYDIIDNAAFIYSSTREMEFYYHEGTNVITGKKRGEEKTLHFSDIHTATLDNGDTIIAGKSNDQPYVFYIKENNIMLCNNSIQDLID